MAKTWHILAFESTHAAMAAQKLLAQLNPFVIPTPKQITASCGMSLRMGAEEAAQAKLLLEGHPDIAALSAWHVLESEKKAAGEAQGEAAGPSIEAAVPVDAAPGEAVRAATANASRAHVPIEGDPNPGSTLTTEAIQLFRADGTCEEVKDQVQVEHTLDVYVNEILTMRVVCTPDHLFDLIVGRLFTEGLIEGPESIERMELVGASTRANIYLKDRAADLSRVTVQTVPTCCTGNQVFNSYFEGDRSLQKVKPVAWEPEWVFSLARQFATDSPMHKKTSGSHSCYLAVRDQVLYCCEDLGRHNAFDKVIGCALRDGVDLTHAIIFTSGRLPVDMVLKGIRSRVPILVSKAVPTDMTVRLAREFNLTLICSARPDSMKVFNSPTA